ncbi:MAG: RecQ family ATP-dependent DNA helicase [Bacteroidales bacterium]|nr:RecQ family ATP-dependent DNA helicase [Bacteroidales bacterium]
MLATLKKYWGYDSFRPKQEEIISQALAGEDVLALMPTGGGKSICFQVPAMMKEGICIVVSPLIALMKDQVENLRSRGIPALLVCAGMTYREIDATLDNAVYGEYKFLYVSPERLRTTLFLTRAAKMNINFLVVDEAHCISQWGYDFRPEYLKIAEIRDKIGGSAFEGRPPVIALTATATEDVAQDIMARLDFKKTNLIVTGFERPNLSYSARECEDKLGQVLKVCQGVKGSGIVYVSRRKTAEDVTAFLTNQGVAAAAYHAGMNGKVRAAVQNAWKKGETRVIVSTNAFGMGIDKGDVRFVCHYDIPQSPEAYFQEAGRAGRDGKKAYALLIWNRTDLKRLGQILQTTYPPLDYIKDIYQKVHTFLQIPYEEGKEKGYKFDLAAFAKKFKQQASKAYYAIKYIEMSGYWNLTEELDIPSKICVLVSREEMYSIQLGSAEADAFLKTLMRMYEGLYSGYVTIDEERIAAVGKYSVLAVERKLKWLASRGVIRYIQKVKSPVLYLACERLYPENLRLDKKEYDDRVARFRSRLEAIENYAMNSERCRSQMLLEYFGQKNSAPCGVCDWCISHKH